MSKSSRWLDLVAFLLGRTEPATRETIFERVAGYWEQWDPGDKASNETLRRKFERDKEELRDWGIDIETIDIPGAAYDEPAKGYRLKPANFYQPYLELQSGPIHSERSYRGLRRVRVTDNDLEIFDRATRRLMQRHELPLARAAASIRAKLEFDLPVPTQAIERALAAPIDPEAERSLEVLQGAIVDRVAVACRYYAIGRDEHAEREIEPYGLFFTWGKWYCVALAKDRDALRVFRVDRMTGVKRIKGASARFRVPADFSVRNYLDRAPWELSGRDGIPVRVRFRFPESRWVQNQGLGRSIEPLLDDGGAVLEFNVTDDHAFLRWLLTFREQAAVEDPPSVAQRLDDLRARVAAIYEEGRS